MTISFDLHIIHGLTGAHKGPAGADNKTLKGPISKHVKDILRGLKARGEHHKLMELWAELPNQQYQLAEAEAMPGPSAKRLRGRAGGPRGSHRMGDLGSAK